MRLSSSEKGRKTDSCKPGNLTSGSIKSEGVLDQLNDSQLPKNDIYPLSQLRRWRNLRIIQKYQKVHLDSGQIAVIIIIIIFLIMYYSFVK